MEASFQKNQSDCYTITLVFFVLGECVHEVDNSQANYQGYRYDVNFLWCHTFVAIYSVNCEGFC